MIRTLALCLLAAASASAWAVDGLPDSTFGFLSSGPSNAIWNASLSLRDGAGGDIAPADSCADTQWQPPALSSPLLRSRQD